MGLEKQLQISEQREKEVGKQLEVTNSTLRRKIEIFTEEQKSIIGYIRNLKGQTVNIGPAALSVPNKDISIITLVSLFKLHQRQLRYRRRTIQLIARI